VKECHDKFGRCIIAVAEGIHDGSGKPIISKWSTRSSATPRQCPAFRHGALADRLSDIVKKRTNIPRVRGDTFGYLQRSFLAAFPTSTSASPRSRREGRAVRPLGRPRRVG